MNSRLLTFLFVPLSLICFTVVGPADDDIFGDDDASTATGDILESRGDLAEGLGKGTLLRSLSAKQLQKAIDERLENREESVELYYELRELRDEEVQEDYASASQRKVINDRQKPNRLGENQIDKNTGEIFWPSPLDDPALKPYRKPIEDTLDKRGKKDVVYRQWDYLKVHRMLNLINEAIDSIEDELDPKELVALREYLDQIDFEARFTIDGERVDI